VGSLQIWLSRAKMQDTWSASSRKWKIAGHQVKRMSGLLAEVVLPLILLGFIGAWFIARQLSGPSAPWSRARTVSAKATTRGRWPWCAATNSAICNSRSSACART
jgi:hypothetical protein